ncbi:hypothetical protein SLEP1_g50419 [Rubroshorea leprosula]|uniref:Helitron helicase-like domain-containing protein n=1 Tax=Rubroshorea leprosula TaxID=152421 RepID=A0AAV5M066_9ROSI|nr:hypothetical protein SLEP1_g50419 [Rubroshorea leprosula]
MRLIRRRNKDGRTYNLPSASEVAALVVGDIDGSIGDRDIIIETQSRLLQRIDVHHPLYLALQYPLLFPYGEDGYRNDVMLNLLASSEGGGRKTVSMREFFTFHLQNREKESQILLSSRKLFQQFMVDAYTMIEAERLNFLKYNQTLLRADLYRGLNDALSRGEKQASATGKRIVLPSSFTKGPRYMSENCKDAFAICRWAGYSSLFITITCNPKWPEIMRFVSKRGLRPEDRPDILCRVFKIKLDHLLNDLRSGHIFGRVLAYTCTIEFQKRGLRHAHILLWLHSDDKPKSAEDLDKIISAEIPDEVLDPELYDVVKACMMCGRANPKSPCMKGGKNCTKHFPRGFCSRTTIDEEGFPHYRRKDNGRTVKKKGVELDNRYAVPYNAKLLLKYKAHINVEYTCQTSAIKYLFKYIHKGNNRVTAILSHPRGSGSASLDEIQRYYDCRYVSACEAAWRIFGFPIHYRSPSVQRLSFHLEDKKYVIYKDNDDIEEVLNKVDSKRTMFEAWLEASRKFDFARELIYAKFPTQFVYNEQTHEWTKRKKGFAIGRIANVPPGIGEEYYLRILLNIQRGCRSYEDIRTINGIVFPNFKEACYALGWLDDDKEYIDAINEAHLWGQTAHCLRQLFASYCTLRTCVDLSMFGIVAGNICLMTYFIVKDKSLEDKLTNSWDDEFHNVVQMNYATSAPHDSHEDANASLPGSWGHSSSTSKHQWFIESVIGSDFITRSRYSLGSLTFLGCMVEQQTLFSFVLALNIYTKMELFDHGNLVTLLA